MTMLANSLTKRGVKAAKSSHLSACFAVLQVPVRPGPFRQANAHHMDFLLADAQDQFKQLMKFHHPDVGGDPKVAVVLTQAMTIIERRLNPKPLCETIDFRPRAALTGRHPAKPYAQRKTTANRPRHTKLPQSAATGIA